MKRAMLIAAEFVLAGCSSGTGGGTTPEFAISGLVAVQEPGSVLAYDVSWQVSRAAPSDLLVTCSGIDPATISDPASSTRHHVFVMGLVSGAACTLTASARSGGVKVSTTTTLETDPLPAYLPAVELSLPAAAGVAPGWTLVGLANTHAGIPYTVALLDALGRFRWYFQYPTTTAGADTPVTQYAGGVVVGGRGVPLSYITWQGEVVWRGPAGHHEARAAEIPGDFYTLDDAPCSHMANAGGVIYEYDPGANKTVWSWALCDHYTPPADVPDWSHTNTVSLFPDKASLLLSSRNQNSLLEIDRASGNVLWVMGYHGASSDGFHGDFAMTDADRFHHQHDATLLPSGNILLFDNGEPGVRQYSRAAEYAYTFNPAGGSEAHVVWQYRHDPDIYADIWGSAQRLPNGDTLVDFGQRDAGLQSTIVEVSADSKPLWEIRLPEYSGVYRAERVLDPPRGFVLP